MGFIKKAILPLLAPAVAALAFGSVPAANASNHPVWDPVNESIEVFSNNTELEFDARTLSCTDVHMHGNTDTGDPGFIDFMSINGCISWPFTSVDSFVDDIGNADWELRPTEHTSNPQTAEVRNG